MMAISFRLILVLSGIAVLGLLPAAPQAAPAAFKLGLFDHTGNIEKVRSRRRRVKRRRRAAPVLRPAKAASIKALGAGRIDQLFGTSEKKSSKFKPFKKWTGAVAKMAKEQADTEKFAKRFKKWITFLDTLKGKDQLVQIKAVNTFMNKSKYIQDNKNWGIKDYWASPGEFIAKFGDCEDFSIAKYMALKYLGFDIGKMRIVAVKDMNLKVGHAILAVYMKDKILILDNQIKVVADSRRIRHYKPVYSINEKFWWRHRPI